MAEPEMEWFAVVHLKSCPHRMKRRPKLVEEARVKFDQWMEREKHRFVSLIDEKKSQIRFEFKKNYISNDCRDD